MPPSPPRPSRPGSPAIGSAPRWRAAAVNTVGLYATCIVAAFLASALLVAVTGGSPWSVFQAILDGSVRSPGRLGMTLVQFAPILLVAIGTIVQSRAGMGNIGQEGQVIVGAAATAFAIVRIPGPGWLVLILSLMVGVIGGALWAGIAALLKYWRNVPEVITTLLLIFVAMQLLTYGLTRRWLLLDRQPGSGSMVNQGELVPTNHRLPTFGLFGNQLDLSIVLAIVLALLVGFVLARTVWGFRLRMLGLSPRTAQRNAVSAVWIGSLALMISGGFAGLAGGAMLTGGMTGNRMTLGFSSNVGWEGLLVALLARSKPLVAIVMAFVFASLRSGSGFLAATGVDRRITGVVQALLVLALLMPPAIEALRARRLRPVAAADTGAAPAAVTNVAVEA